jgi:hypothetical protein
MKAKVKTENTLAYATAFIFSTNSNVIFAMKNKIYRHISTVYDRTENGTVTLEIVFNITTMKYETLNCDDKKIGGAEIRIL